MLLRWRWQIARTLIGNDSFYNLPRKFKICATGCPAGAAIRRLMMLALPRCGAAMRLAMRFAWAVGFEGASSGGEAGCLCEAGAGGGCGSGDCGDFPRSTGTAREPRPGAVEVSVFTRGMDGGDVSGGDGGAAWVSV